ncbi:MAG: DNA methyltransferase [Candidatus Ranarchaeia archaeon]
MNLKDTLLLQKGIDIGRGRLYLGDNLDLCCKLGDNQFNLIYCDPPYCSGREYFVRISGQLKKSFSDKWAGGISEYLHWIKPRFAAMWKLLSSKGVLLVHTDWHVSHYVKVLLDKMYGMEHFLCEFIWRMFTPHLSKGKTLPARTHQTILAYIKDPEHFCYFPQYLPYRGYYRLRAKKDENGRLWVDQNLGRLRPETISRLKDSGRVFTTATGRLRRKQYLDEMPGEIIGTVIDHISRINSQAKERVDYETQKPEELLQLFIKMFTAEGDLVADFFCGSGTTPVACEHLNRRWIACDSNPIAIKITLDRLRKIV